MRAITPVFSVLLIIILSVALVGFLWLFATGTFNALGLSGTSTVNESLVTISSCMKIESVYGNQVSIRNCGKGVVSGNTLGAYLDDVPLNVTPAITSKTFGKTNVGATTDNIPFSYRVGNRFQLVESGFVTSISAYISKNPQGNVQAAIYSDNGGNLGNLLVTSNPVNVGTGMSWVNFPISKTLNAGYYWLSLRPVTSGTLSWSYDNNGNRYHTSGVDGYDYFPSSDTVQNYDSYNHSIYAIYTLSDTFVNENDVGTFTLSGLWNFNVGGHTLRIANPRVVTEIPVNAVLPDSCVLSLDFDEGSGLVAYDSSAYGNNGTLKNYTGPCGSSACPQWVGGKFGNALQFDGIGDYVEIPYSDIFNITDEMTVSAWIYPSTSQSTGGSNQIIQRLNWNNNQGFFLREGYGPSQYHNPQFSVGNGSCGPACWQSASAGSIAPERWYHILGSVKANDKIKIYLNGAKKAEGNYLGIINQTSGVIDIGLEREGLTFNGTIDSIRIYNQILTPDQTISLRPVSYD